MQEEPIQATAMASLTWNKQIDRRGKEESGEWERKRKRKEREEKKRNEGEEQIKRKLLAVYFLLPSAATPLGEPEQRTRKSLAASVALVMIITHSGRGLLTIAICLACDRRQGRATPHQH